MSPAELLWDGYAQSLGEHNIMLEPLHVAQKSKNWPECRDTLAVLDDWINKNFRPADTTERVRSYRIVANAVLQLVFSHELAPIGPVLMKYTKHATAAVDRMFPGYAKGNLLRKWVLLSQGAHRA